MQRIYAHSKNKQKRRQTLQGHVDSIKKYIDNFVLDFKYPEDVKEILYFLAETHDIGKAHPDFQKYLIESEKIGQRATYLSVDHKELGAYYIYKKSKKTLLSLIVSGHHGGLKNKSDFENDILKKQKQELEERLKHIPDQFKNIIFDVEKNLQNIEKFFNIFDTNDKSLGIEKNLELELYFKMLFSCLVNADHLSTESHMNKAKNFLRNRPKSSIKMFYKTKKQFYKKRVMTPVAQRNDIDEKREFVFQSCVENGLSSKNKNGFYILETPTGLGKTQASFAFALEHAILNNKNKIIFLTPYMSITSQVAKNSRDFFGKENVLEHHSSIVIETENSLKKMGYSEKEINRILNTAEKNVLNSQDWNFPFIISTFSQFYDSLLSNMPSKCKKLHNVINSVIVIDEIQSVPIKKWAIFLSLLKELVKNYNVSILFTTATHPDYSCELIDKIATINSNEIKNICPEAKKYFSEISRVEYYYKPSESIIDICDYINNKDSIMLVCNTRSLCFTIYDYISDKNDVYFLSGDMCATHKMKVIEEVRAKLKENQPCKLITTQLVECGVDLDFPIVMRQLSPITSLIQSAGRCNRNGRLNKKGEFIIFDFNSDQMQEFKANNISIYPDNEYEILSKKIKEKINTEIDKNGYFTLDDADLNRSMFRDSVADWINIKKEEREDYRLLEARSNFEYEKVGQEQFIKDSQVSAIIIYEPEKQKYEYIVDKFKNNEKITLSENKIIAQYSVQIYLDEKKEKKLILNTTKNGTVIIESYDNDCGLARYLHSKQQACLNPKNLVT